MSRYLSVWLPQLSIERVRRRAPDPKAPAALWIREGSARRIASVNEGARRLGLTSGVSLAVARAMLPGLILVEDDADAQAATLSALLAWSRRFTPLAAFDPPDGLMLDVAGVPHLFGGEEALAREVVSRLAALGFTARVGLADSPELAVALARHGERSIAPAGLDERALAALAAPLPLAALRLPEDRLAGLAQAGLRRIGDVLARPRAPLAARWGALLFARVDALLGRARSSISPVFEAPPYVVERKFAEPIARREDVEGTIAGLALDLAAMLERHGEGLRRAEASFFRVDGAVKSLRAGSSRPLREAAVIARLFRERLESFGEEGLDTGYGFDLARLSALEVERLDPRQGRLTTSRPALFETDDAREEIDDLVDRLGARLGTRRVLRLRPQDSHIPECAEIASPAAAARTGSWPGVEAATAAPTRPLRLLETPERIEALACVPDGPPLRFRWRRLIHEVAAAEGPERIASEWWLGDDGPTRDYFRVEDRQGRRFWLYRQGLYGRETARPQWFVHGLFA